MCLEIDYMVEIDDSTAAMHRARHRYEAAMEHERNARALYERYRREADRQEWFRARNERIAKHSEYQQALADSLWPSPIL